MTDVTDPDVTGRGGLGDEGGGRSGGDHIDDPLSQKAIRRRDVTIYACPSCETGYRGESGATTATSSRWSDGDVRDDGAVVGGGVAGAVAGGVVHGAGVDVDGVDVAEPGEEGVADQDVVDQFGAAAVGAGESPLRGN